jgi:hypothetical protein
MLTENSNRRLLSLIDECDGFFGVAADPELSFAHTTRLQNLMNATDRRFKPVFAGPTPGTAGSRTCSTSRWSVPTSVNARDRTAGPRPGVPAAVRPDGDPRHPLRLRRPGRVRDAAIGVATNPPDQLRFEPGVGRTSPGH